MENVWRELAAMIYLRGTYFFKLSSTVGRSQYSVTYAQDAGQGILCAAWWPAYTRVQPTSASGRQTVEAGNAHRRDWCSADAPRPTALHVSSRARRRDAGSPVRESVKFERQARQTRRSDAQQQQATPQRA